VERAAPNLNMFLWRPILAEPPLYLPGDLEKWVTIRTVLDCHEALDLKASAAEKAQEKDN
jgi:hypothetical protein